MDAYSSWIVRLARQVRHAAVEFYRATKLANELRFSYGLAETNHPPRDIRRVPAPDAGLVTA